MQLIYNPQQTSFEALCNVLWGYVDPTLKDQVGLDRGSVTELTAEQKEQAAKDRETTDTVSRSRL